MVKKIKIKGTNKVIKIKDKPKVLPSTKRKYPKKPVTSYIA